MGFTIFACIVIFIAWAWAYKYVYDASDGELKKNRKWIEQLPALISTLGVIGTFAGITIGLVHFDPDHLDDSIPGLLEGLQTAFFTSLLGMVGSLILSRRVNHAYDKMDEGNESKEAAKIVVEAIKELQAKNEQNFKDLIAANDKSRREMVQTLQSGSLKEYIEQMADDLEEAKAMLQSIQQSLSDSNDSSKNQQLAELSRISAELLTASVVITKMGNDMDEIKETLKEEE